MAKKALKKDLRMEIKRNRSRFISIFLIVALGVAFFSGLRASESDMRYTADRFADDHSMMDLRIISTMGLTDADVEQLETLEHVETAEGSCFLHVLTTKQDTDYVLELIGAPQKLNTVQVTEGRMPEKQEECLADNRLKRSGYELGDTIEAVSGTDTALEESLTQTSYTIVGFGDIPLYLGMERGSATIGSGQIAGFLIVEPDIFKQDYYSQIYLTAKDASAKIAFTEDYEDTVALLRSEAEGIAQERCRIRLQEIKAEAREPLDEAQEEYDTKKSEAETSLQDARAQLDDGWRELETAKSELALNRADLEAKEPELLTQKQTLEDTISGLSGQRADLEARRAQLAALAQAGTPDAAGEEQLTQSDAALTAAEQEAQAGLKAVEEGLAAVKSGFEELEAGEEEVAAKESTLQEKEQEYLSSKLEAETELADAKAQLDEGWSDWQALEEPEWLIYDRDDQPGYFDFGSNAQRIGAIGKVFPAIFFLVAALVALTAITRMVEEQRTQIGTYKALGYQKGDIMFKYLSYALAATLGGGIAGVLIGEKLFPFVIIICYRIIYAPLLEVVIPYHLGYAVLSILLAVVSTSVATLAACYRVLSEEPAVLMRPVSPKAGRRVWLEHLPFLWKRLSFSQKAALRNLFRYKKRLIMTVFGIGCCCGLMVVGFGLRDSIMNIASIQYDNIQLYDAMVSIEENAEDPKLEKAIAEDSRIEASARLQMKSMDASTAQAIRTVYVVVAQSAEDLEEMMVFRSRTDQERYELDDSGVIISEQLSGALGIKEGDHFVLKSGEERSVEPVVAHVAENYLMHYVYMTKSCYRELYGEEPADNMYWLKLTDEGLRQEEELGRELIEREGVMTVTYVSTTRENIENMLNSLYLIVIVLVISASLLAFVVIYNLNNINISERRRELATIKLLGFYNLETAAYIYRENIYLTIVGALVGLGIGKLLHSFVINTIEVNQVMFGRQVSAKSYVSCVILTIVFSVFVNAVMYFQIKRIDMVESLKSVE